jgi:hypothetical protein
MKKIYIIIIFLLSTVICLSQRFNYNQFEIRAHYGTTMPHHSYMNYIITDRAFIGEINYSVKTDGSKSWHSLWHNPELGVGYLSGELGNNKILGYSHSIFGFWGVPVIEKERIILKYRLGAGLGYLTKKFDVRSNYYDLAIGSHFNAHLYFALLLDIKPFDFPLYISPGITFNHFSSGAIDSPNLGLNQFSLNIGIKYMYSQYPHSLKKMTVPYLYNPEWEVSAYYAASTKENNSHENKKHFVNTLLVDAGLRTSLKRSWGLGMCFIYDTSLKMYLDTKEQYKSHADLFRIGIHAYHEVYFTYDLSLVLQAGSYVYNKYRNGSLMAWIYTKFGLRYTFSNGMFANIILKTHYATADYIEFGIGYRFLRLRNTY